ncbi:DUF4250 domain-containing protein [Coraliomargarita sp. SDUM461004]|uniref:DUF4250 domain-containing protein n=1 Tax=Thalassobacterium sedimentorum TaxID=3041258 RepID=A0ABU1AEA6_9BACT|nr:DUF4250 domain-containing protein [Coraliomargarita sp. SDUM461004]MDQ8193097.1 DUF4250 domain-containing protein [Coraliomargarita sp. SDUM461004]
MDWSQFQRIDPHLLVGLVNTELRNHAASLDDLCRTHDIDRDALCAHLASADYHYKSEQQQFR